MEVGSNKSLFTLIAVVIFGIFIGLSYFLFQDQMKSALATVMDKTSQSVVSKTDFDTISNLADISDPILAANIRSVLGLAPDKVLTRTDLEKLTSLTLIGKNITSIEGLQYAINLKTLNLNSNKISDLTPLKNLTELTYLNVSWNQVSNLKPLSNLINLKTLYLYKNYRITDLEGLENMYSLTYLDLDGEHVTDLSPLSRLTNLESLDLQDNLVSDLTPLSGLNKLKKICLIRTKVNNISPIANKPLTNLYLNGSKVTDYSLLISNGIPYNTTINDIGHLSNY